MSPNQGQGWNLMAGGIGNPLIVDAPYQHERQPGRRARPPTAPRGGSSWPCPPRPAMPCRTRSTQGWLYAAVATPAGGFFGLFVTKDFGQNWIKVRIPTLPQVPAIPFNQAIPTNDVSQPDYPILGGNSTFSARATTTSRWRSTRPTPTSSTWAASTHDGQTGLIRVDATNIWDAHNLTPSPTTPRTAAP